MSNLDVLITVRFQLELLFARGSNFGADVILAAIKFIHIKWNVNDMREEKKAHSSSADCIQPVE